MCELNVGGYVAPCVEVTTGQLGLYPLVLLHTAGGAQPGGAWREDGPVRAAAVVGEVICPTGGQSRAPATLKINGAMPTFVLRARGRLWALYDSRDGAKSP